MTDLLDLPEFEWPLHKMLFYPSTAMGGKYLICARGPGTFEQYGANIVWREKFDTAEDRNATLDEIVRLQALTASILR